MQKYCLCLKLTPNFWSNAFLRTFWLEAIFLKNLNFIDFSMHLIKSISEKHDTLIIFGHFVQKRWPYN